MWHKPDSDSYGEWGLITAVMSSSTIAQALGKPYGNILLSVSMSDGCQRKAFPGIPLKRHNSQPAINELAWGTEEETCRSKPDSIDRLENSGRKFDKMKVIRHQSFSEEVGTEA